ncbi:5-formyltetrahydrofolate cyclo-ligase [Algicella marina]|uniref:5-formyltetrahydrofolate cyclo-ligase n=1 Tax=Algicella marina TaxID=2683284 RepID=A0A6P1T2R5_9RHOB|nr:5-formyltetrahydrofolate cyclo-ligase [Algicella marina]QHQ35599.1 5-formyltetrahydrofolate cyclo-ligase [Algicella marina]
MTDVPIPIKEAKTACRKRAFADRASLHGQVSPEAATAALVRQLKEMPGPSIIAGYMPIRTEISPLPALEALSREGHVVCMPQVVGPAAPLRFLQWSPEAEMVEAEFGVAIPKDAGEVVPDVLVVPLLAFDTDLYRMGYGGGFYDRTIEKLGREGRITTIGFAYDGQRIEAVPHEPTDQQLDVIVTEREIYHA